MSDEQGEHDESPLAHPVQAVEHEVEHLADVAGEGESAATPAILGLSLIAVLVPVIAILIGAEVNDIVGLHLPRLSAIAHNGGESFKHARHTQGFGVPVYRLPSSSPANASWSFERKRDAWREVFMKHGLL